MEGYRSPDDDDAAARLRVLLSALLDTVANAELSREEHARDVAEVLGSTPEYADEVLENVGHVCERFATGDITPAEVGLTIGLIVGDKLGYSKAMNTTLGPIDPTQEGAP